MFDGDFREGAMKGAISTEPFIDDDAKSILITGRFRMGLDLLRGHIGDGSGSVLVWLGTYALNHEGDAEVAEEYFVVAIQEHVLWFDIAMDKHLIVSILQGGSDLGNVGDDGVYGELRSLGVALAQVAAGGILHDEKRGAVLYAKVEDLDDMGMPQAGNGARFGEKSGLFSGAQVSMQDFDSGRCVQVDMFCQVDVGEVTASEQLYETIVAEQLALTSCGVDHGCISSRVHPAP